MIMTVNRENNSWNIHLCHNKHRKNIIAFIATSFKKLPLDAFFTCSSSGFFWIISGVKAGNDQSLLCACFWFYQVTLCPHHSFIWSLEKAVNKLPVLPQSVCVTCCGILCWNHLLWLEPSLNIMSQYHTDANCLRPPKEFWAQQYNETPRLSSSFFKSIFSWVSFIYAPVTLCACYL